jgi:hypothetical protein
VVVAAAAIPVVVIVVMMVPPVPDEKAPVHAQPAHHNNRQTQRFPVTTQYPL